MIFSHFLGVPHFESGSLNDRSYDNMLYHLFFNFFIFRIDAFFDDKYIIIYKFNY